MIIWTVFDNYNLAELGAYRSERKAYRVAMDYLDKHDELDEDDILIEPFTLED